MAADYKSRTTQKNNKSNFCFKTEN